MIDFTSRWINIDASARCSLECPKCIRQSLKKQNIPIPGSDMTIDQFEKIINYFDGVTFCGQISDPIFSPKLIDFLKMCKIKNKSCHVHTAASQKTEQWYEKAFKSNIDAKWIFGIDGLPNESHLYRINQDGEKLFKMMLLAKSLKLSVVWQYIVFSYNENHVNDAEKLAKDNDIEFEINISARWNDNDWYRPKSKEYYMKTFRL